MGMWFQTGSRDDTRACKLSCSLLICSWGAIGNTAAHLGVVRLRGGQQSLQAEQGGLEGERGAPLVLEDVQADGPVGAAHCWGATPCCGSASWAAQRGTGPLRACSTTSLSKDVNASAHVCPYVPSKWAAALMGNPF